MKNSLFVVLVFLMFGCKGKNTDTVVMPPVIKDNYNFEEAIDSLGIIFGVKYYFTYVIADHLGPDTGHGTITFNSDSTITEVDYRDQQPQTIYYDSLVCKYKVSPKTFSNAIVTGNGAIWIALYPGAVVNTNDSLHSNCIQRIGYATHSKGVGVNKTLFELQIMAYDSISGLGGSIPIMEIRL